MQPVSYCIERRPRMKLGKTTVRGKTTLGMEGRLESQNLTPYSGLILFSTSLRSWASRNGCGGASAT